MSVQEHPPLVEATSADADIIPVWARSWAVENRRIIATAKRVLSGGSPIPTSEDEPKPRYALPSKREVDESLALKWRHYWTEYYLTTGATMEKIAREMGTTVASARATVGWHVSETRAFAMEGALLSKRPCPECQEMADRIADRLGPQESGVLGMILKTAVLKRKTYGGY